MLSKIKFGFLYWLIWIFVFEISRGLFLLYNFTDAHHLPGIIVSQSFLYGLRMDASMASYLSIPVFLFLIASVFIDFFTRSIAYYFYTAIILLPVLLIIFFDLPVYKAWGSRLDSTALKYLAYPKEALASVSNLPVVWILIFFFLCYLIFFKIFGYFIKSKLHLLTNRNYKIVQLFLLLIFAALQIIPLRGGLQLAPLNQSSVYFSKENFANLAAINVSWNFMNSLYRHNESKTNPFAYLDSNKARSIKDSLLLQPGSTEKIIDQQKTPSPNIIIVIWESFTEKATLSGMVMW